MNVVVLMENTPGEAGCLYEHGLSVYIETKKHRLLVDTGASAGFAVNAKRLGIDLRAVDTVILSHGHYDHAGGLLHFAELNPRAGIYMQRTAGNAFYHKNETMEKYIGIDRAICALKQVVLVDGSLRIDEELFLYTLPRSPRPAGTGIAECPTAYAGDRVCRIMPPGNTGLMEKTAAGFRPDTFDHEQYLVIEGEEKRILVSGCAHKGIINILNQYREIYNGEPDAVISGFHMRKKNGYTAEDTAQIKETARQLASMRTVFYTGHCTGEYPFAVMQEIMGREQLVYVHSGEQIPLK